MNYISILIKMAIVLCLIIIIPCYVSAQVTDTARYNQLNHEYNEVMIAQHNYLKAAQLFDEIYAMDTTRINGHWKYAINTYDKINQPEKALNIIRKMVAAGDLSFCIKDYAEIRHYSADILNSPEFTSSCKDYTYAIEQPCEHKAFRDSIMKYLILASDIQRKQTLYIKMGYEKFYPTEGPFYEMSMIDRIKFSEVKLDSLVAIYGYPTKEKMVDNWVTFLFGGSLIHSTEISRMKYYIENFEDELPKRTKAYMVDKIAVQEEIPQTYGTQLNEVEGGGFDLYPTQDIQNLNKRRAKVGLEPMEIYLQQFNIDYEVYLQIELATQK